MKKIIPGHGSGGKLMNEIIDNVIVKNLGYDNIQLDDSAIVEIDNKQIVFTTDSFTITPIFFPGGDIGSLAVNGTINDLSVMGATPLYLSCALILEEGFEIQELEQILRSMRIEADNAGVKIVTGDTKVVPRGKADKIFINTTGIGLLTNEKQRKNLEKGDKIIINGTIGDHGIAVMAKRNNLSFSKGLVSDCAHLNHLIRNVIDNYSESVKFMRDPTRGGVASVLNEVVKKKDFSIKLYEDSLPIKDEVKGICAILGLEPLYVANEGKVLMIVDERDADNILKRIKEIENGKDAVIIGEIDSEFPGRVYVETSIRGRRILPPLVDEQLPRIC